MTTITQPKPNGTPVPEVYTNAQAAQAKLEGKPLPVQEEISLLDDDDKSGPDIPEVKGQLSQDGQDLIVRIPLASLTPAALKRVYTDKAGNSKTTKAFKLSAVGRVGKHWVTLSMGGWRSTMAIKAEVIQGE